MAVRCNFGQLWTRFARYRKTSILDGEVDELVLKNRVQRPWRINEAAALATLDTVLAVVGYLLYVESANVC